MCAHVVRRMRPRAPCIASSASGSSLTCVLGGTGCAPTTDDGSESEGAALSEGESGLRRHYAAMLRSEVPVEWDDGRREVLRTTVRGFLEVDEAEGSNLRLRLKACSFDLPAIGGFTVTLSDDVLQRSVPEVVLEGRVERTSDGTRFKAEETVLLLGLKDIGATEALPGDKKDPRLVDQDGDGEPGFSLRGSKAGVSGRIFTGLRAVASGEGTVAADGSVVARGALRYDFAKDVQFYGDSIPIVDAAGMARDIVARMKPVPGSDKHEFRMEPLDDDASTDVATRCAAVKKRL